MGILYEKGVKNDLGHVRPLKVSLSSLPYSDSTHCCLTLIQAGKLFCADIRLQNKYGEKSSKRKFSEGSCLATHNILHCCKNKHLSCHLSHNAFQNLNTEINKALRVDHCPQISKFPLLWFVIKSI